MGAMSRVHGRAGPLQAPRSGGGLRLLDADPDLGQDLGGDRLVWAVQESRVQSLLLPRGVWEPEDDLSPLDALFVLGGTMARELTVGGRTSLELLTTGQLLRPCLGGGEEALAGTTAWRVLAPSWVAVLDPTFWSRMGPYPSVLLRLTDRGLTRARSLAVRLALVSVPNLAARLRLLLWHLADAHGRVTRDGVLVDIGLSHELIAQLASARRPSVSKALKELEQAGDLTRLPRGGYLLHGPPPYVSQANDAYTKVQTAGTVLEKAAAIATVTPWPF